MFGLCAKADLLRVHLCYLQIPSLKKEESARLQKLIKKTHVQMVESFRTK